MVKDVHQRSVCPLLPGHGSSRKRDSPASRERSDKENKDKRAKSNSAGVVGSGRQAAQGIDYEEKDLLKAFKEERFVVSAAALCKTEQQALSQTGGDGSSVRRYSRLRTS